jgi:tRNA dimethylallyltransferase
MNIGTDKPTSEEMTAVPHHLFNIINPDADFGVAQYHELANQAIREIHGRNKVPLLVGGSGQYVWAVLEGWDVPRIPPDREFRRKSEEMAVKEGVDCLYDRLREIDPESARRIDKRNVRRVIRALEVALHACGPFSVLGKKNAPDYEALIIGLTTERKELYRRIDSRVDLMMQKGLVAEVENLIRMGYGYNLPALNSIGYRQIGMALRGEITLEEAIESIKTHSHKFVRHQYAWFGLDDKRIHWFDVGGDINAEVTTLISNRLSELGSQ